jgi:hypothetical protein
MKHIKLVGLCFVAMVAISAVVTVTASAAPTKPFFAQCTQVAIAKQGKFEENKCKNKKEHGEWQRTAMGGIQIEPGVWCQEAWLVNTGFYEDAFCTKEAAGQMGPYDLVKHHSKFTGKSGAGKMVAGETKIECKEDKSEGEFTENQNVTKIKVIFTGCKAKNGTKECEVKGGGGGKEEIKTEELVGEIGYLHLAKEVGEGKNEVGLDLKPAKAKGAFVKLEGTCIPLEKQSVEGSIIGEVRPLNTMSKEGELIYKIVSGKQAIREIEMKHEKKLTKDILTVFGIVEAPLETTEALTFEDAVEVVA